MKKLSFLFLLTLLPLMASAYDAQINGIYYNFDTGTKQATVTSKSADYLQNQDAYAGSVIIPENVTYNGVIYSVMAIGDYAFVYCTGMTEVTIPNSVTSIGAGAFGLCSGLTSVTIPNSVASIGDYVFYNCDGLSSVTIPSSVIEVGDYAFDGTAWYDNQPDGLIYIGNIAYKYKGEMPENTSITIKDGTTGIGMEAFNNCAGLISVTFPNSIRKVGKNAFNGTAWYDNLPEGMTYIGMVAFKYKGTMPENTSITLKEGTTSIAYGAFTGCTGMTSVTIPQSVTSIGGRSFYECSGLTSVTIPNGVKLIDDFTFGGCSGLTSVIIPNSVTSIGGAAFSRCSKLTEISIPNSVTSIGGQAFAECKGFTSIAIPNSVTSIGSQAFYKCYGLTEVYCYAEEVPTTHTSAFQSINLQNVTLYVPDESAAAYQTTAPWSDFVTIKTLSGETPEIPETPKCATPTISFADGKVTFSCETEGVEYVAKVTCPASAVGDYEASSIPLTTTYIVTVYAKKDGYDNSEVATKEIEVSGGGAAGIRGDVNGDKIVNGTDIQEVINIIVEGQ